MFSFSGDTINDLRVLLLIKNYWVFLLISAVMCFPAGRGFFEKHEELVPIKENIKMFLSAAAFIISVSFVVSGINNPFVYANF